ncbi:MAG: hypothetical protein AABZ47_01285 [Planctomycetota bacterium]
MAKMFYSSQEAAARLGKGEGDLKDLVRAGTLREFRDAGKVNYKVQDVDTLAVKLAAAAGGPPKSAPPQPKPSSAASSSGEIVLEAVEDSGIELASSGSDIVMLEEADSEETRFGATTAAKKAKEGTVVPSVGLNVFDDDELDEHVDPLAQTAVTDVAGLGLEGGGSGSGILDLSRESDDTSLGAELLEEIYTGDEGGKGTSSEMGEDTRAGLDDAIPAEEESEEAVETLRAAPVVAGASRRVVTRVVEYESDPWSTGLTAGMVVAVMVLWVAGLAGAAMVRGVMPSLLNTIYTNLAIFSGVAVAAAGLAVGLTYFFCKKRAG